MESAGMACEGRARNRMLRKRWIVRNPGVGEDDITQFILARPFNTSWPLFMALLEKTHTFFGGGGVVCVKQDEHTFQTWLNTDARRGFFYCLRDRRGNNKVWSQVDDTDATQIVLGFFNLSGVKQHLLRHRVPRRSLLVIWLFSAQLI